MALSLGELLRWVYKHYEKQTVAVMMSQDKRLGANSPLRLLDSQLIQSQILPYSFQEWKYPRPRIESMLNFSKRESSIKFNTVYVHDEDDGWCNTPFFYEFIFCAEQRQFTICSGVLMMERDGHDESIPSLIYTSAPNPTSATTVYFLRFELYADNQKCTAECFEMKAESGQHERPRYTNFQIQRINSHDDEGTKEEMKLDFPWHCIMLRARAL